MCSWNVFKKTKCIQATKKGFKNNNNNNKLLVNENEFISCSMEFGFIKSLATSQIQG